MLLMNWIYVRMDMTLVCNTMSFPWYTTLFSLDAKNTSFCYHFLRVGQRMQFFNRP